MAASNINDFGLSGKVAIVTGAGSRVSGIGNGRGSAVVLAQAGARVALIDSIADRMAETEDLIKEAGGTSITIPADVSDRAQTEAAVTRTVEEWGRVDVLVNNVGIKGPDGSVVDVDLDMWDRTLRVNLTSMLLMSRFSIPHMIRSGGGSIINMSSSAGLVGGHPRVGYATTKAAILALTRTMATTHGPQGVRVNAVAPGSVETPMVSDQGPEYRRLRAQATPLKTPGTGWDVAEAVLFLASEHSRWITGATLPVDGGLTINTLALIHPTEQ
jgi:NAD(P)-dependent dehydrogenase (short-subunit alcohol dehydrogenase family)